ncbi:transglutaminase-like domain-containing protein [Undibacterium sp. Di24W]|uniref:transglutaminase-like domain-containing protein n=1 Tax=Undibacterium sp. Di24W TaxID=3413033 RepID=UPI003BF137CD
MERSLGPTTLLDFNHPCIIQLVTSRGWLSLPMEQRIAEIYAFVQNEIAFGYNEADDLPASRVLADGIGQCNTKGTLIMALFRKCEIPCRFHGFTINKALQKGAISGIAYVLAPTSIIHSWVEIWHQDQWINLEGFILDKAYLRSVQEQFKETDGAFCGYGIATTSLAQADIEWVGKDTYIQKEGINHDFGIFDTPDDFYAKHGSNLSGIKRFIFLHWIRQSMNRRVQDIRRGNWSFIK